MCSVNSPLGSAPLCALLMLIISVTKGNTDNTTTNIQISDKTENTPFQPVPQIRGFNSSNITSGPILLVNKKTFFIPNLQFNDIQSNDSHSFWAGKGEAPSASGYLVPVDGTPKMGSYRRDNIYLTLPDDLTMDNIHYLSVWSEKDQKDLGYVTLEGIDTSRIDDEISDKPDVTKDGKQIYRVPKCCPFGTFKNLSRCENFTSTETVKIDLDVFESNMTHIHINNGTAVTVDPNKIEIQPYFYSLPCPKPRKHQSYLFESDIYGLIYNSSLSVQSFNEIYLHGDFCVDFNGNQTSVIVCFEADEDIKEAAVTNQLYVTLLLISALCFAIGALLYWFVLKVKDVHKICFVAYSTSMCITFVMLILLQMLETGCQVTGYFFIFFTMFSFSWLAILCTDLIYVVRYFKEDEDYKIRIFWYTGISLGISFLILIISIFIEPRWMPNVPKSYLKMYSTQDFCISEDDTTNVELFFIPMGILIVISMVSLGMTYYGIQQNEKKFKVNYYWLEKRSGYKFMWSQCSLTLLVMCLPAAMEVGSSLISTSYVYYFTLTMVESLQGVFVLLIFFSNHYNKKVADNKRNEATFRANRGDGNVEANNSTELQPLRKSEEWI